MSRPIFLSRCPAFAPRLGRLWLCTMLVWAWSVPLAARAERVELFFLWGLQGRWDGSLSVEAGTFQKIEPYSFETEYGDQWLGMSEHEARFRSGTAGQIDGLHVWADVSAATVFRFRPGAESHAVRWADVSPDRDLQIKLPGKERLLIVGRGDPAREPRLPRTLPLPAPFQVPVPQDPLPLPDQAAEDQSSLRVRLFDAAPGPLKLRRGARNDGRLYVELYCPAGPIRARAEVTCDGRLVGRRELSGSLWLSLLPRVGMLAVEVLQSSAAGEPVTATLHVPTTLVETRGTRLYVNGEPFLVKGTLPRNLTDDDAALIKSWGANTLRVRVADLAYLEKYKFLGVVVTGAWSGQFCTKAQSDAEYRRLLAEGLAGHAQRCAQAAASPYTLMVQHANEQVSGSQPWEGRIGAAPFDRLDYLLACCYNLAKPLDPMLPQGYSNCAFGYRVPDFLDVYLHNTYLEQDRHWPPLEQFVTRQGCDRRPFVHTEFGANVYMPQAYLRGPNSPVLEKLHAWNYPLRWREYLRAGNQGAINYCLYDYDYAKVNTASWDRGFTNFGVFTFDRHPKLAAWELWHLWRDFEIEPADSPSGTLRIRYAREYRARRCRLILDAAAGERTFELGDFAGAGTREVPSGRLPAEFRWRIDYTTHGGLPMTACGVYPRPAEAADFLKRLKPRATCPFLCELFDAEVLSADGRRDATTLAQMQRDDGIVPVVFRKPNGVCYATVFTRRGPRPYCEGVQIDLAIAGRVVAVDELTGQPSGAPVDQEPLPGGVRLKNLRVPWIPASYGQRQQSPVRLPVFRIEP